MTIRDCPDCAELEPGQLCAACHDEWLRMGVHDRLVVVADRLLELDFGGGVLGMGLRAAVATAGGTRGIIARLPADPAAIQQGLRVGSLLLAGLGAPGRPGPNGTAWDWEHAEQVADHLLAQLLRGQLEP
jgi:hypothetical protein